MKTMIDVKYFYQQTKDLFKMKTQIQFVFLTEHKQNVAKIIEGINMDTGKVFVLQTYTCAYILKCRDDGNISYTN